MGGVVLGGGGSAIATMVAMVMGVSGPFLSLVLVLARKKPKGKWLRRSPV